MDQVKSGAMDLKSRRRSFWTTVPGILTGIAAVITAIGTILAALEGMGFTDFHQHKLSVPTQTSPADGMVFSHYPRQTILRWESVSGAEKYMVKIETYASRSESWEPWRTVEVHGDSYNFTFAGAQPGRWCVWAVDSKGNEGDKSGWWRFNYTQ